MTHRAAWINSKGGTLEVGAADTPRPGAGEMLVKIHVIAFSPVEYKEQRFDLHGQRYPQILGHSYAGTVESIGTDVRAFQPSDRVAALRPLHSTGDPHFGSFQQYALADPAFVAKLAPDTLLESGATTILNLTTVCSALTIHLGLGRPTPPNPDPRPREAKTVLIYGGSSSLGGLAIQYAVQTGHAVTTTSSPPHRASVAALGPAGIVDHTRPAASIVDDLRLYGPYDAIFDCVGTPSASEMLYEFLSAQGGGAYNTVVPALPGTVAKPGNVERRFASYGWDLAQDGNEELRAWLFGCFLPGGLAGGWMRPTKAVWVAGGLGNVQKTLDRMAEGVTGGGKLVMDPWAEDLDE